MPKTTEKRWIIIVRACFDPNGDWQQWGATSYDTRREAIDDWDKIWVNSESWRIHRRKGITKIVYATITTEWDSPGTRDIK